MWVTICGVGWIGSISNLRCFTHNLYFVVITYSNIIFVVDTWRRNDEPPRTIATSNGTSFIALCGKFAWIIFLTNQCRSMIWWPILCARFWISIFRVFSRFLLVREMVCCAKIKTRQRIIMIWWRMIWFWRCMGCTSFGDTIWRSRVLFTSSVNYESRRILTSIGNRTFQLLYHPSWRIVSHIRRFTKAL